MAGMHKNSNTIVESEERLQDDVASLSRKYPFEATVSMAFPSPSLATIAMRSLATDPELQKDKVRKVYNVRTEDSGSERGILEVIIFATEKRLLRVAMSSLLDMSSVCVRTQLEFSQ